MANENAQQQELVPQGQVELLNPFDQSQFKNIRLQDTPLAVSPSMMDALLTNKNIPEHILEKYWFAFNQDNVLSFQDPDTKKSKMLNFDIAKIDTLFGTNYYDYTFDQEAEYNKVRHIFETKIDRAVVRNTKNERIMLATQMQEQRHIQDIEQSNQHHSFWKRLVGRR